MTDFTDRAEVGPGLSAGVLIEWSGAAQKTYLASTGGGLGSSAGSFGALYGEWGIGVGASGSYWHFYGKDYFTFFASLSFRLPFGAGVAGISNWSRTSEEGVVLIATTRRY